MIRLTVLDDYQNVVRTLSASKLIDSPAFSCNVRTAKLTSDQALIEALADADAVVLIRERTRLTARVLQALPQLKLIVQTGRLSGCIDLDACREKGIAVREGSGNPIAPTELTWALILAASRRLVPYAQHLARGRWQRTADSIDHESLGRALHGRTIGVWSYGKIGRRVAAIARAFGMTVLVHGRAPSREAALRDGFEFLEDRRTFFSRVDVLTLHLRLSDETRHLIGEAELSAMKPDALLVNTSRSELLTPGALLRALDAGRPGSAAIDVFDDEPYGAAAFAGHPRILATPHIGFVELDTYEAYFSEAFGHVRRFFQSASAAA
jgi:D-3-phosphoglycerate dehydrogenase / 2-oxoglutarate reductase